MRNTILLLFFLVLFKVAESFPQAKGALNPTAIPFPNPWDLWNCSMLPYPPPPATNVNQLRPGNIQAIMGDSITAGFAMQGIWPITDFLEWRDYVYSIGGHEGAFTLPNILQLYNPNIKGAAQSFTRPLTPGAWGDGAVSMAKVEDLPSQVEYLKNEMVNHYKVDLQKDWKLLTIFIGANNICDVCKKNNTIYTPKYFEEQLRAVLNQIETEMPRTFVNLLTIFNISGVYEAGIKHEYCRFLWEHLTSHECNCLTTGNPADRLKMDQDSVAFNEVSEKLAKEFQDKKNPEFTVVVQPGLSGINIAYDGEVFLSKLDCFHPSIYADQAFTYQLWNNMMSPQGQKSTSTPPRPWDKKDLRLKCPSINDFLQ